MLSNDIPTNTATEWMIFDGIHVRGPLNTQQILALPNPEKRKLLVTTKGYRQWYPLAIVHQMQKKVAPQISSKSYPRTAASAKEDLWSVGKVWSGMMERPEKWSPWPPFEWADIGDSNKRRQLALQQLSCYAQKTILQPRTFLRTMKISDRRSLILCFLSSTPWVGVWFLIQLMNELQIRLPKPSLSNTKI